MKKLLFAFSLVMLISACMATNPPTEQASTPILGEPLVVGVATHYRPIIFRENNTIVGLEADFAKQLAKDLGRPLTFKEYKWDELFTALNNNEIDIIMAGASVTPSRQQKYLFSEPYMTISQMAMVRKVDGAKLNSAGALHSGDYKVGYISNTTGEEYVINNLQGQRFAYANEYLALNALIATDIDYFIHDSPTVWHLANSHNQTQQEQLLGLYTPLTQEQLAWVINKNNPELMYQVNTAFYAWLKNGFLRQKVQEWIPVTVSTVSQ